MNIKHFFSLYYRAEEAHVTEENLMNGGLQADDYYLVRRMPLAEMFASNVVELADEVIAMTLDADWVKAQRRSIAYGDIICWGLEPWMYASKCPLDSDNKTYQKLNQWPKGAIFALKPKFTDELICKAST